MKELKDSDSKIIDRKVVDIILLIICWMTISPLMLLINRASSEIPSEELVRYIVDVYSGGRFCVMKFGQTNHDI